LLHLAFALNRFSKVALLATCNSFQSGKVLKVQTIQNKIWKTGRGSTRFNEKNTFDIQLMATYLPRHPAFA